MADSFTHLHVHTEYSMLDGAARIGEVVAAAAADGQPALGITDHGNMYGVLDFYKACQAEGIKPIIGSELYMAHESRHERPSRRGRMDDGGGEAEGGKKLYYHLTALAETNEGYRNLIQLSSEAYLTGYHYKPKADFDLLAEHSAGLIATSGCLGGHVLQHLLRDDYEGALKTAGRLQDIFGRDGFFIELQDHGIAEQRRTNPALLEIAKQLKAPLLATNDSHYVHREDSVAHDALLCVQTGSQMSDPDRFKFHGDEHYLKSAHEMRRLFEELPQACDNTLWVAERADVEIEFGKPQLPTFPLPPGFADDAEYLRHLTMEGARRRWGDGLTDAIVERISYELGVIESMGFSSYFLIVWDLIKHARDNGIRVGPGRGSAAGCAVAYSLWITDLDPIEYDLLFERFLNPSRISMPDIDMDFDSRYRDEMIRYAAEKYGRDHVAQIVTFSTIKARAAVRDAARVLGYPYVVGDKVAKAMPPLVMGRDTPLYACLEKHEKYEDGYKMAADLRKMRDEDPDAAKVIEVAKGLEGLRRQDGIHAAAVVITKEPLTTYLPIQRKPEGGKPAEDSPIVTQYEMHGVEDLGLLKMDFLGLRNLDVITDTLGIIEESRGVTLDIDAIPLDDELTLALLCRGEGIGIFQLEGGPMRALTRALAPTSFEDVAALVALYRPGPMAANMHYDYADRKNGRKPVEYFHPDAEEILADTYGLMIYQESVMRVAQRFAGYSLAQADNLRKACLPKGTNVLTRSRGYQPIEKLMSLSDRRVHTIDTDTSTSSFDEVAQVWSVGVKPVLRLTTSTGYTIEATDNHPLLVEDRWTELGAIKAGDLVAVVGHAHTKGGSKVSDAEIELAALLISEGYVPDVHVANVRAGHFGSSDPELLDAFRRAYEDRFERAHSSSYTTGALTQLRLRREEILELEPCLGTLGMSTDKSIPPRIVNAPTSKVERFLGLFFSADGWADARGAHIKSRSAAVCRSLKRMLLRCGVVSEVHRGDMLVNSRHCVVSIADKGHAKVFAELVERHLTDAARKQLDRWVREWNDRANVSTIGIPTRFVANELARSHAINGTEPRSLGLDSGRAMSTRVMHWSNLGGLLYSDRLEDLRTGDLLWDTVVSVEPAGEQECFDFEMADQARPYAVVEDFLVHNCGKKNREVMAKERQAFVDGVETTGYERGLGTQLFDIIEQFADYAFPKSHSFGYGYIAYQTAYLKAHYPAEYLAALLTSVKANLDKAAIYLAECRTMGIEVLVPDVNRSVSDFTPVVHVDADTGKEQLSIVFGLSAVRNVGSGLVALLLAERDAHGPFADFYDFVERVDFQVLNKKTIESLIKAGGFDSLGHPRQGLLRAFEHIIDTTNARRRERDMGVMSLFGEIEEAGEMFDERPPIPDVEFAKRERLSFEKEMLGLYVSDHPLLGAEASLRRRCDGPLTEVAELEDGSIRTFGGVVTGLQRKWTRKGDLMAVFALEDLQTAVEVMVFPKSMTDHGHKLADDAIVTVRGRVDAREEQPKLIAMDIEVFEPMAGEAFPLRVKVAAAALSEGLITDLKRLLGEHPGDSPVLLHLADDKVLRLPEAWTVDVAPGLLAELRVLLGPTAIMA